MRGNIEKYDKDILYGWIDGGANLISFNVFVNDIRIGTLTPTILRKDVLQDLRVETEYPMVFEFTLNMSNIHIKKHIKICCSTGKKTYFSTIADAAKNCNISAPGLRSRILTNVHINDHHWKFNKGATHYSS